MAQNLVFKDILAGPIVRRVERGLVSIWVALAKEAQIKLSIWEGYDKATSATPGAPFYESQVATQTIRVGANLHLALVVLSLPSDKNLKFREIYAYNLRFSPKGVEQYQDL